MADQEKRLFFINLKKSLESFFFTSKSVAKSVLAPLGPSSEPSPAAAEEQLHKLKAKLQRVRATLRDAEALVAPGESAKLWLRELRDVECGLEDILEKIEFEAMRIALIDEFAAATAAAAEPVKRSVRDREVGTLLSFSPLSSLGLKIKKIWEKYYEIAADREALRLMPDNGVGMVRSTAHLPTSSFVTGELHGREDDFNRLLEMLLNDSSADVYTVVSIIGMAGVGKTAIVQHVYNGKLIQNFFDLRIWICASRGLDVVSVTKTIMQACGGDTCDVTELSLLQDRVVDLLKDKRFLLVLDDVWSMSGAVWERLQGPLMFAAQGSKVVVTSRNLDVAKIMGCDLHYRLHCLSDGICWSICKDRAFDGRDPEVCLALASIGEEIVKKCKGLPLAAKAVGGLLRTLPNEEKWNEVLDSDLWTNDELVNEILPALMLSYDHLPFHLKHCFAYCSLFPKGYIFDKEELIRLWMGQGFIERNEMLQPEDVGCKYFDDLVRRCFLQQSPFYDVIEERYEMHDLFHELAQSIAEKEYYRIEDSRHNSTIKNENIRHSSLVPSHSESEITMGCQFFHGQNLRTLLVIGRPHSEIHENFLHVKIPYEVFSLLECLRALDLSNTSIILLPESVGNLIHLRYLGLRNTKLKRIPESACGLLNLQTLDLGHSYYLDELPRGIKHLVNLRHLKLPIFEYPNISIPAELGLLTGLRTLNAFVVGSDSSVCGMRELCDLVNLHGELHISGLMNVCHVEDAENANLGSKAKLRKLVLKWWSLAARSQHLDAHTSYMVLERLKPHPNLEELTISGYCGVKLSTWLGDRCFVKLVKVVVEGCENCGVLPSLGQLPCLKHLKLQEMEKVRSVGREFIGPRSDQTRGFPVLETLELRKMYDLENWYGVEDGDFPCLQDLNISGCNKLRNLPLFDSLINLRIQCCERLHDLPVLPRLKYLKLEGFDKVMHLPLPKLPLLEILEVGCCEQLSSLGSLQHLASLQWLKITRCPMLHFSRDEPLPSMLKAVHMLDGCQLLSKWSPSGFERIICYDQENHKLVKCDQLQSNFECTAVADCDSSLCECSSWNEEIEHFSDCTDYSSRLFA